MNARVNPPLEASSRLAVADTIPKSFLLAVERRGDEPAIREKDFGIWKTTSWNEWRDTAKAISYALAAIAFILWTPSQAATTEMRADARDRGFHVPAEGGQQRHQPLDRKPSSLERAGARDFRLIDAQLLGRGGLGQVSPGDHAIDGVRQTRLRLPLIGVGVTEVGEHVARAAGDVSSETFINSGEVRHRGRAAERGGALRRKVRSGPSGAPLAP